MVQKLANLTETASQTAGPYVHIGLVPSVAGFRGFETELGHDIAGPQAAGERIRIEAAMSSAVADLVGPLRTVPVPVQMGALGVGIPTGSDFAH